MQSTRTRKKRPSSTEKMRHSSSANQSYSTSKLELSSRNNLTCKICNKTFSRTDNLRTHQRLHTGERPFACRYCGQRFRWASALDNHEDLHEMNPSSYVFQKKLDGSSDSIKQLPHSTMSPQTNWAPNAQSRNALPSGNSSRCLSVPRTSTSTVVERENLMLNVVGNSRIYNSEEHSNHLRSLQADLENIFKSCPPTN